MEEKYLITDASVETVSAFEVLTEELEHAGTNTLSVEVGDHGIAWWTMVLALRGSNGLDTLRPEDATRCWSLFSSCSGSNPGGLPTVFH